MEIGDLVITPQGTLVRILAEVDSDYQPADPDTGYGAWGYVVFKCSDDGFYDDRELTPIEYPS
jgi:hypothetical protein